MHAVLNSYQSFNLSNHFSLYVKQEPETTCIIMKMTTGVLTTKNLPQTFGILQKELPTILLSECFNDKNLSFSKEVKKTEIGHLFEHILLEYLCVLKLEQGFDEAEFCGTTNWDWLNDERGTFHITISSGQNDSTLFYEALNLTISLITIILDSELTSETDINITSPNLQNLALS